MVGATIQQEDNERNARELANPIKQKDDEQQVNKYSRSLKKVIKRDPTSSYYETSNPTSRRGPSPSSTFPAKLHAILSCPELCHIITWMPHGCAWRILQPKLFAESVMPKYFTHQSKYSSFTRQVNGWGFKRITHGPDRNSYYHRLFVRGMPHLTRRMMRLSGSALKKSGGNENDETEPNFYETSNYTYPLPSSSHGHYHSYDGPAQHHEYSNHHWNSTSQGAPSCYQNDYYPHYDTPQQAPFSNVPYQNDHYHSYNASYQIPHHSDVAYQQQPYYNQYQYSSVSDQGNSNPLLESQAPPLVHGQYYEASKVDESQDNYQQQYHHDYYRQQQQGLQSTLPIETNKSMQW